jgi:hypothetical protein
MSTRKPPFVLVEDVVSTDTVECLRTLLQFAESGEVIGVAYAAMLKKRGYIVNTAGEAHRSPTYSRGMMLALDDKLAARIRGGNP